MFKKGDEVCIKGIVKSEDVKMIEVEFPELKWTLHFLPDGRYDQLCDKTSLFRFPGEEPYPFMLYGKPLKIGDEIECHIPGRLGKKWFKSIIYSLTVEKEEVFIGIKTEGGAVYCGLDYTFIRWPEIKKRWAYINIGNAGDYKILFTEPMTEFEAVKRYGKSAVRAIPEEE